MESNQTGRKAAKPPQTASTGKSPRLHYLDWLQVLAILGVFLLHAVHPFDDLADWHIKNVKESVMATFYAGFFNLWGIPFFFLMSGATSWFSLRRRTEGRYARECVTRLLIPFIIGALVLTPIQAYYELTHKGWWDDSWCAGGQLDVLTWHARILYLLDVTQYQRLVLDVGRFLHRDTLP